MLLLLIFQAPMADTTGPSTPVPVPISPPADNRRHQATRHSACLLYLLHHSDDRLVAERERVFIDPRLECLEKHRPDALFPAFRMNRDIGDKSDALVIRADIRDQVPIDRSQDRAVLYYRDQVKRIALREQYLLCFRLRSLVPDAETVPQEFRCLHELRGNVRTQNSVCLIEFRRTMGQIDQWQGEVCAHFRDVVPNGLLELERIDR